MLAPTPCLEGCGNLAARFGRCKDHQKPQWFGSSRKKRLPQDWSTRRQIVLRRDRGICYLCNQPGADAVDHKVPGDDHSLTNLAAVHEHVAPHCHRLKSSQEGVEARLGSRIKRRH
jgi:5-methylcytosine-specific restriction endonuclease McrA